MRSWLPVSLWALLFLAACSRLVPERLSLDPGESNSVQAMLAGLVGDPCGEYLDADLTIGWQGLGRRVRVSATLQARRPGRIRLAATDPLGRPQMLLVIDGGNFVFLDIPASRGYSGSVASAFMHRFLPPSLPVDELTGWLTGTLDSRLAIRSMGKEVERSRFWVEATDRHGQHQFLCLDDRGRLLRRLLVDRDGGLILEAVYRAYKDSAGCRRPGLVELHGSGIQGDLTLRFSRYYPPVDHPATDPFQVRIPPGFSIQRVE